MLFRSMVSRDSLGRLWQPFIDKVQVRTDRQVEMLVEMIDAVAMQYQRRVATINRQMRAATDDIHTLRVKDIATLAEYERKLNDYLDALIPMNWSIEKLLATQKSHRSARGQSCGRRGDPQGIYRWDALRLCRGGPDGPRKGVGEAG